MSAPVTSPEQSYRKPAIIASDADYDRLTSLAAAVRARSPEIAEELQDELERAQVVAAGAVPADVVQMGSTVEFRWDGFRQRRVTLVFPVEADIAAGRISVLTPIGTALIGLSPGQSIRWTARDGREHELTVLQVEPPAAAASARLAAARK
ncbi:MAG: nucleoside diphosphate kinase regulator [Rhodospirillales bacterium]